MSQVRVTIADDHALFRQGLRSMLRLQPDITVVGELERADELAATLDRTPCDIVLLDLQMERSAFLDIETLAERVAVIVVTASERVDDAVTAIRAGARALVFKRFALETLMTAIRTVMQGQVWLPPTLQSEIANRVQQGTTEVVVTPREREVIRHVARGLRNAEVAEKLAVTEGTVKTHLNNVFQKLGLRDRVELTLYAVRMGLIAPTERRR
jgi:DNA-binding NarL/FixJ family response regulator